VESRQFSKNDKSNNICRKCVVLMYVLHNVIDIGHIHNCTLKLKYLFAYMNNANIVLVQTHT
jgi:hypothetical protein